MKIVLLCNQNLAFEFQFNDISALLRTVTTYN